MSNNVFVYGTLMLPEVVEALTGKFIKPKAAILRGYKRYIFKNRCYPGIIKDETGHVEGAIYVDVDNHTLSILDWFEDVLYERHLLTVEAQDKNLQAFVYVVPKKFQHKLDNLPWLLEKFIEDYSEVYIKKCLGYRKQWENKKN